MSVSRYSTEALEARRRRGIIADTVWYWAAAVVGLYLLVLVVAGAGAVSPAYCGTCHSAERSHLETTKHEALTCDSCHTKPGVFGLIDNRAAVAGMVPARFLPGVDGPRMQVSNEACYRCHADVDKGVVVANGLRMSHKEVSGADWACTECHADLAHDRPNAAPGGRYTMGQCLKCHSSNSQNVEACGTCHVKEVQATVPTSEVSPWKVTHGPRWETTHGMGELSTCKACHPADYCARCHNMIIPHPASFAARHGDAVIDSPEGRDDCLVCHKGPACDNCHGIQMPHPTGFLQRHSAVVKADGEKVCERCHDEQSCGSCHRRHLHPGIPVEMLKELKSRPVKTP